MDGAHNTCWNARHTLCKKCICARACAHMQRCRSFFEMEIIANLSWILREYRTGCRLPPADAALPAVSTKPNAQRCLLKISVQIHDSSWRGRRCSVAQTSFDHPHWKRPLQFVYGLHLRSTTELTHHRNPFLSFFAWVFFINWKLHVTIFCIWLR